MLKHLSLLCFLVLISKIGFSQKTRYLQFYGNPFVNMFQDANAEFITTNSPNTLANYAKLKSGEIGLMYRRKFENKTSWGVGIGSRFDNYSIDFAVVDNYVENNEQYREVLDAHFINLYINKLNLRLQFSYHLTERISIGLNLNTYLSNISPSNQSGKISSGGSSKSLYIVGDTSWTEFNYAYNLNIKTVGGNISLVPELFVSAELLKGLSFITGAKMAFWGKNNHYLEIETNGSFRPESGEYNKELLHKSAITARDFGYFMGFTYDLQILKKR